jgi:cell division septum initiation protein DivIVA
MLPVGVIIRAIVALIITAVIAGGLWYVSNVKADLVQSQENARRLEEGIQEQKDLLKQMVEDVAAIQQTNRDLQNLAERYRGEVDTLTKKFSQDARGNPRDFGQLAREKPELVERLVNRGTRNAMRCLELASGAVHTQEELAAKSSGEINKECPAIANPNYRAQQ